MQLTKALFTHSGDPPWPYVELRLCRDVYHCTPSQLDEEDWDTVKTHLALMGAEDDVRKAEAKIQ